MHKCAKCGDRTVLIGKNISPIFQLAHFFMLVPIENMKFKSELDNTAIVCFTALKLVNAYEYEL